MISKEELGSFIKDYLKDNLTIDVKSGDFTFPNDRTITVIVAGDVIAKARFDVTQKPEYEG